MSDPRPEQSPSVVPNRRRTIVVAGAIAAVVVAAVVTVVALTPVPAPTALASSSPTATSAPTPTSMPPATLIPTPAPTPTPTFDSATQSIDDPNSYWVVADKLRPLNPLDWEPPDLVEVPHQGNRAAHLTLCGRIDFGVHIAVMVLAHAVCKGFRLGFPDQRGAGLIPAGSSCYEQRLQKFQVHHASLARNRAFQLHVFGSPFKGVASTGSSPHEQRPWFGGE